LATGTLLPILLIARQDLWSSLCRLRWPTLIQHLKDDVVLGNWKHLYRARSAALKPQTTFDDSSDNDDDGQGIEDFVFTVELWTEEKKSPKRRKQGENGRLSGPGTNNCSPKFKPAKTTVHVA
jgi:hypothetical protein